MPAELIERYQEQVGLDLVDEWKRNGLSSYAKGVLWFVNPAAFEEVVREWLPGRSFVVVMRTAFGDLFLLGEGRVFHLHVHYARLISIATVLRRLLNAMDTKYVRQGLDGALTEKARAKVGDLAPEDMFTFEPALALGGAAEIKYVNKVKLFPQLSFLAQVHGKGTIE